MHGNILEWCQDRYGDYPSREVGDYVSGGVKDPSGATSGAWRVIRGGGWHSTAEGCESAVRYCKLHYFRSDHYFIGFRVSLSPSGK
jgi:formylglycine-generating enzyme required for sulfatase activity